MSTLAENVEQRLDEAARRVGTLTPGPALDMLGRVESIGDDVATVSGLPETRLNELLLFERKDGGQPVTGMVLALDPDLIGCAMLGRADGIAAGNRVRGTGSVASVPVGEMLLGRVVNPLGIPLDGGAEPTLKGFKPVDRPVRHRGAIAHRSHVTASRKVRAE
jgi:F-type H+-transporting ATPase subunit alpha